MAEIIAGLTTFLTMSYIVVVNPTILSTPGTGIPFSGALTATVLVCFTMTLLMGVYAKLPFGVAPGMGLNAFFAYTLVINGAIPWPVALGIIFWAGVLFLLVSATPLRERIAMSIPHPLRAATAGGIGLLLAFIGLQNAGFVAANPATLVGVGALDHRALLTLAALIVSVFLARRQNPFAYLAGIALVTGAAWAGGYVSPPASWISTPDFSSVFLKLDIRGALQLALIPAIVTVMMTDLFDSLSTFIGVAQAANFVDEKGEPKNLRQGLIVDAFATFGAGLFGSSPGTAYVESISGIRMGGRTGLTAVVTALCFLPCLFIAPVAASIPNYATSAVLILVGVSMFHTVSGVDFTRLEIAVPAFATLILIPLTFSITQGILWGFILHAVLHLVAGRGRDVTAAAWGLAAVSVVLLVIEHVH
ncbi:MAG TPA: NCS2 family permease [Vicinamibacterales bacterium]|nr:NCS2 family permease [Vicinamibacterales bacterium]